MCYFRVFTSTRAKIHIYFNIKNLFFLFYTTNFQKQTLTLDYLFYIIFDLNNYFSFFVYYYLHIYVCVCVCVCVLRERERERERENLMRQEVREEKIKIITYTVILVE